MAWRSALSNNLQELRCAFEPGQTVKWQSPLALGLYILLRYMQGTPLPERRRQPRRKVQHVHVAVYQQLDILE